MAGVNTNGGAFYFSSAIRSACVVLIAMLTGLAHAGTSPATGIEGTPRIAPDFLPNKLDELTSSPPAQLDLGGACALPVTLPFLPAALVGPLAGPLILAPDRRCTSLRDSPEASVAGMNVGEVAFPFRPPDTIAPAVEQQIATPAAELAFASPRPTDWTSSSPATDSQHDSQSPRDAIAPTAAQRSAALATELEPAISSPWDWGRLFLLGCELLSLVLVACCVLLAWVIGKRWFGHDNRLIRAARAGLARGEFRLEYQPVVSLRQKKCVGLDVLLRWNNSKYGVLGPSHFMQHIESSDLIGPLTRFIFSTVAKDMNQLRAADRIFVSVKVPAQYVASQHFIEEVDDAVCSGLPQLVVEISADSLGKNESDLTQVFSAVRAKGVRFALGGVGQSAKILRWHDKLHFEMLKFDGMAFNLNSHHQLQPLIKQTRMYRQPGGIVVVVGVDVAVQDAALKAAGVELGQGFFYSRALRAAQLESFLSTSGCTTIPAWQVTALNEVHRKPPASEWMSRHLIPINVVRGR